MAMVYFTINNRIVQDALSSLAIDSKELTKNPSVIAGGMATQLHCVDMLNLLRPTCDIDVLHTPFIEDYKEFSGGIGKEMTDSLKGKGYHIQLKGIRKRPNYEVKLMNNNSNKATEMLFIHFNQHVSEQNSPQTIKSREIKHSTEISYKDMIIKTVRIEDILPRKIKRLRRMIDKGKSTSLESSLHQLSELGNWRELSKIPLESWLIQLTDEQNRVMGEGTKTPTEDYIYGKHMYDICLLSRKIEGEPQSFNKAYFLESKRLVDSL